MNRLLLAIRAVFPPRRRLWRYVSPHRRMVTLVLLAALVAAAYGYWYLTNDHRTRSYAKQYLQALTGGRVEIAAAHFSPLGGVELWDVRLYVPGQQAGDAFFRAKKVIFRHKPWDLLFRGRLAPRELICLAPSVTLEHDVQTDSYNFQRLSFLSGQGPLPSRSGAAPSLPPVKVYQGVLRWVDVDQGMRVPFEEMPVSLSIVPSGNGEYLITFEEQHTGGEPVISAQLSLDPRTGRSRLLRGVAPIPNLDRALPGKYRQWRRRYQVTGEVRIVSPADSTPAAKRMDCELADVSLVLPAEEGGLELAHVCGKVMFDETGVTLNGVTGVVLHGGGGQFTLSGRYEGYEADSPYEVTIAAESVLLPLQSKPSGALAEFLNKMDDVCRPSGKLDLSARLSRDHDGKTDLRVSGELKGMSATCKYVPYRIDGLRGKVEMADQRITMTNVVGTRNGAGITVNGTIDMGAPYTTVAISASAKDLLLDGELRDALPDTVRGVWDEVDPSGRLSLSVNVESVGQTVKHVGLAAEMTGQASARSRYFPYPLENLVGKAEVNDGNVVLQQVRASRGLMRCVIDGRIDAVDTDSGETDLTIDLRRLPLDDDLTNALPPSARGALASLHPGGWADRVACRLVRPSGGTISTQVDATISEASFKPDVFPYEITQTAGELSVVDGVVAIRNVTARVGEGAVVIAGQADLRGEGAVLDLTARAEGVRFDDTLQAASAGSLARTWARFSPSGLADVDLILRSAPTRQTDYRLTLRPRDMQIRYEGFPCTFKGVSGTIVATPNSIEIPSLVSSDGPGSAQVSGRIVTRDGRTEGELSIKASDVPISDELIAALPPQARQLGSYLTAGGSCDLDLQTVRWVSTQTAASSPASLPASEPSRQELSWELAGSVHLKDAAMRLEHTQATVTGRAAGMVRCDATGLAFDAQMAADSIDLAQHHMSNVRGRLVKQAAGPLVRVEDFSADMHGGKAAGQAEIALSQPVRYGISLSVENVDLLDLFNSSVRQGEQRPGIEVRGLLTGNLRMTATAGKIKDRQATGVLRIDKARITRLPVMVGLANVIYLWLPGKSTFAEGDVTYRVEGERLILEEIHLRGPAMSVIGSGRVNLADESLSLVFLTGPPGRLPRMAGIESLLKGFSREIAETRVTGTLAMPLPETVSLPSLDQAVRRLLSPYEEYETDDE